MPRDSYLRGDAIIAAARRTGAQAIHPGYGFLSENAEFARACAAAGLVFVGPSPEAIAAMGSKSAAKALMEKAGVPLTPGYHGDRQEPDYLLTQARAHRLPGADQGGVGRRRQGHAARRSRRRISPRRWRAVSAKPPAAFGDPQVLVEKYLTTARHIEVQVFGDQHGDAVYLFERDCSVQRRHQKVIEEAPAPGMTAERRRAMGEAAVAAARAVNYSGAGTVEFIAAPDGAFYFMEMNTRLQVEHPVTEMITGLDLVEWQLRVAAGEPLPLQATRAAHSRPCHRGARLRRRSRARIPALDGPARTSRDSAASRRPCASTPGSAQGDEITPYYDPMIAKLIVHGETREAAIGRMRDALARYEVVGVRTNVEFLARLMTAPAFVVGESRHGAHRARARPSAGAARRAHEPAMAAGSVRAVARATRRRCRRRHGMLRMDGPLRRAGCATRPCATAKSGAACPGSFATEFLS